MVIIVKKEEIKAICNTELKEFICIDCLGDDEDYTENKITIEYILSKGENYFCDRCKKLVD